MIAPPPVDDSSCHEALCTGGVTAGGRGHPCTIAEDVVMDGLEDPGPKRVAGDPARLREQARRRTD